MKRKQNILWVDGVGAVVAGMLVLLFHHWLSELHGLPRQFVLFLGAVNLIYASYSTTLAIRAKRTKRLITILVVANAIWGLACLVFISHFSSVLTIFGLVHLLGEGLYVAGLAFLEWRWKAFLIRV